MRLCKNKCSISPIIFRDHVVNFVVCILSAEMSQMTSISKVSISAVSSFLSSFLSLLCRTIFLSWIGCQSCCSMQQCEIVLVLSLFCASRERKIQQSCVFRKLTKDCWTGIKLVNRFNDWNFALSIFLSEVCGYDKMLLCQVGPPLLCCHSYQLGFTKQLLQIVFNVLIHL